jgi:hypothetical protein
MPYAIGYLLRTLSDRAIGHLPYAICYLLFRAILPILPIILRPAAQPRNSQDTPN